MFRTRRLWTLAILAIAVLLGAAYYVSDGDLGRVYRYVLRESRPAVLYQRNVSDRKTIRDYWETHPVRKLQLGAGPNLADGWLNTDIEPEAGGVYLDATSDYPFPSESFHFVFAEHLIEHLPWEGGLKMLQESHRVLAPGGKMRVVTPNLAKLIHLLNNGTEPESRQIIDASRRLWGWPDTPVMPAYVFNRVVRDWGHTFVYDPATLRKTFEVAGFRDIVERRIGEETDPVFEEVESRNRNSGDDMWLTNKWGAMAFEGTR
jgi:SAM-dependent methyltransferase